MSKCIKCGRELTSAEIPEFYNGMCEKCSKELNCAEYPFKQGIYDYQKQIDQLKQENEKLFLQLSKQEIDEHKPVYCTLAGNDCKYLGKIKELKQQLEEKDKEIERLKNLFKLNNEVVINQGKEIFDLRVQVLQQKQNQTQLALQELEKVKTLIQNAINFEKPNFVEVYDAINKQIKELKGEKDVKD